MKTAFFLGAGTSYTFGYPLTSEVLPLILERLVEGTLFSSLGSQPDPHQIDRERFRVVLDRVVPGWPRAWEVAQAGQTAGQPRKGIGVGITDVLTLVDHTLATAEGKGSEGPSGLAAFRELLERAIYEVLQPKTASVSPQQRTAYDAFVSWLFRCANDGGISVITTNYDLTIDNPWFERLRANPGTEPLESIDLGFERRDIESGAVVPRPAKPVGRLLKLHGSLNWLRCAVCGYTYVNPLGDIGGLAFADALDNWNTCHCNPWARLRLPLVTPSLARTVGDRSFHTIWRAAFEALVEAEHWYVIGYSMPSEDVAIRSLLCRAAGVRTPAPKVHIIQQGQEAQSLYRALFPESVYHAGGLAEYLQSTPGLASSPAEPPVLA